MRLWSMFIFILFLSDAHARVINVAEEEAKGNPTPPRLEGTGGLKKTHPTASTEGILLPVREEEESVSTFVGGGDTFTGPGSNPPGSNTPGGGVPRIGDGFLIPPPSPQIPWWESWWNAIREFFS